MKYSTEKILQAIEHDDPMRQVDVLYEHEYPKVKAYILKNSGNEDDAMDVFQESLIQLFRYVKLGKYKREHQIGGFLFTVARNEWRQRNRSKVSFVELEPYHDSEEDQAIDNLELQAPSKSTSEIIEELLNSLGENCKQILSEVIFNKTPMKLIAEKLGYADATIVKTRHYKCKKRLIKSFDQNPNYLTELRNGLSY